MDPISINPDPQWMDKLLLSVQEVHSHLTIYHINKTGQDLLDIKYCLLVVLLHLKCNLSPFEDLGEQRQDFFL